MLSDGDAGREEEEEEGGEEEEEAGGDREGGATLRNLLSRGETKRWISSPDIEEGTTCTYKETTRVTEKVRVRERDRVRERGTEREREELAVIEFTRSIELL